MFITLPDGRRIPLDNCIYQAVNNAVLFNFTSGGSTSYQCVNNAGATAMAAQIDTKVAANATNYNSVDAVTDTGALVWTSITPNTATVGITSFVVAGSGFLGSAITSTKLDDGAGHHSIEQIGVGASIDSDVQISIPNQYFNPAGTYTLYFSTDGGTTWTTTGLAVTVS